MYRTVACDNSVRVGGFSGIKWVNVKAFFKNRMDRHENVFFFIDAQKAVFSG